MFSPFPRPARAVRHRSGRNTAIALCLLISTSLTRSSEITPALRRCCGGRGYGLDRTTGTFSRRQARARRPARSRRPARVALAILGLVHEGACPARPALLFPGRGGFLLATLPCANTGAGAATRACRPSPCSRLGPNRASAAICSVAGAGSVGGYFGTRCASSLQGIDKRGGLGRVTYVRSQGSADTSQKASTGVKVEAMAGKTRPSRSAFT